MGIDGGPTHPIYAQGLSNLASVYGDAGRTSEADALWNRALPLFEKSLGAQHPTYARMLNGYADFLDRSRRSALAKRMRRRSQAILAAHQSVDRSPNSYTVDFRELKR